MIQIILFFIGAIAITFAFWKQKRQVAQLLVEKSDSGKHAPEMRLAVTNSRDGIVIQDMNAKIIWANPSFCKMFGYSIDEIVGRNPLAFLIPDEDKPSDGEIEDYEYDLESGFLDEYEVVRNVRKNGELVWNQLSFAHHQTDEGENRIVVTCRDINEQVAQEEELRISREALENQAERDELTGAANRVKLRKVLTHVHDGMMNGGPPYGLLHIDLDRFKSINDTYGHAAGDAVLVETTRRISREVRGDDILCRVGGDEFVILCPETDSFEMLRQIGHRVVASVDGPVVWEDIELSIGASVGVALSDKGISQNEVMMNADLALYEVKRTGRGAVACYDKALAREHQLKSTLTNDLLKAIENNEFTVHVQPQYSLLANSVTGFETLVRWQHPTHGELNPGSFIDLATEIGIMKDIDRIAAIKGLEAMRAIIDAGHTGLEISINVAAPTVVQGEFTDFLKWEADRLQLEPAQIIVEVLETTFFSQTEDAAERTIASLSQAGFRVELDDFGTGYAGLAHLNRLRVDGVKIDQSMIKSLHENIPSQTIVSSTVELCRDLGLHVIAEGVETPEQLELLRDFGCANVQGFLIAKPMPIDIAIDWLQSADLTSLAKKKTSIQNCA